MAIKRPVLIEKKGPETPGNQRPPLHQTAVREVMFSSGANDAPLERTAAFDPRLYLTKLPAGKTSREYQGDESVFSQGDPADAVFYIQSGKVKLTVVSKSGKEAVVAILPEASFFGEGCLAGQTVRMSTVSTVQRSTIIRWRSQ
jgi:CRP/FNR family cyclic AMP-dependent transcriptional regulator